MIKRFSLLVLGMSIAALGLLPTQVSALPTGPLHLEINANTAPGVMPADGSSTTHMWVMAFTPYCGDVYTSDATCPDGSQPRRNYNGNGQKVIFTVSDSSVKLTGPLQVAADGTYSGTIAGGHSAIDFNVAATTPGNKTITAVFAPETGETTTHQSVAQAVTFAALPKDSSMNNTDTPITSQSGMTTTVVGAPTPPTLDTLTVDDKKLDLRGATNITIKQSKSFTLKGKTIPRGTVNLYIHSTVRQASTVANEKGEWEYTVDGLEAGDHYIEAEVFDSASQKTSVRQAVLKFVVSKDAKAAVSSTTHKASNAATTKKQSKLPYIIGGVLLLVAVIVGIVLWRKRRASHQQAMPSSREPVQIESDELTNQTTTDTDAEKPAPKSDDNDMPSSSDGPKPSE